MPSVASLLLGLVSALSGGVDGPQAAVSPAPDEPLLVIVERSHGATASPESIRRAIAQELGRPVVGPLDPAGRSAAQMLVVTLAPDSVAMQMRSAGDPAARRRIEPLANGESSLRVVAWLAGNLARDQASELMDAMTPEAATDGTAGIGMPNAENPARGARPQDAREPPAAVAASAGTSAGAAPPDGEAPWRLELAIGQVTFANWDGIWYDFAPFFRSSRLELWAPPGMRAWSWTAALDVLSFGFETHSYELSAGLNHRFVLVPRWLAADLGWGGGVLFGQGPAVGISTINGPDSTTVTYTHGGTQGPFLVAHVAGSLAFVRVRAAEIVATARVGDQLDYWESPYFAFSVGVRFALP